MEKTELSIIIPLYNEEGNLEKLYREIITALERVQDYEVLFVDDGSTDQSLSLLKKIAFKDRRVKVVKLMANYGQSNAIAAGLTQSQGKIIITMDSDLQHDPKDILPLIEKLKEGYHVVCGLRKNRRGSEISLTKTVVSKFANLLIRTVTGVNLQDSTGGMRAFTRRVVEIIPYYGEMHRYLPILAVWKGFKVTEIPISIRKRVAGKTKYDYKRIFRGLLDLLTVKFFMAYSTRPIHIFGSVGIFSLSTGVLINLFFAYEKIFRGRHLLNDIPSLILGVVLILMGIMFLGFGFLADMITFDAVSSQQRGTYLIDDFADETN